MSSTCNVSSVFVDEGFQGIRTRRIRWINYDCFDQFNLYLLNNSLKILGNFPYFYIYANNLIDVIIFVVTLLAGKILQCRLLSIKVWFSVYGFAAALATALLYGASF